MKTPLRVLSVLIPVCALLAACHSVRRGDPLGRTVQLSSPGAEHGRVVFQQHCHRCHPNGEAGLGPALNNKPAPKFLMKTQVRLGLGAMPSFGKDEIGAQELDDLVTYIVALRKAD